MWGKQSHNNDKMKGIIIMQKKALIRERDNKKG